MTREKWLKSAAPPAAKKEPAERKKSMADSADKHALYHQSAQAPTEEIRTLMGFYRLLTTQRAASHARALDSESEDDGDGEDVKRAPTTFREDFSGTAVLCKAFLGLHPTHEAYAVDIDASVISYSRDRVFGDVDVDGRMHWTAADVLSVDRASAEIPRVDLLCALNYGKRE
jgi:hypothetical protein